MKLFALCALACAAYPAEKPEFVEIEAERFESQEKSEVRKWHIVRAPEGYGAGAGGGAYVEIRPDTRKTHDDKLIAGENFSDQPGGLAVLHYRVEFTSPGRYYVWVRAWSTGTEDNGIHAGIDSQWPDSDRRMQWCEGKKSWKWESAQRTQANHCGEPCMIWLDVPRPGIHTISFSMREDGFRFDKFILTRDRALLPPDKP